MRYVTLPEVDKYTFTCSMYIYTLYIHMYTYMCISLRLGLANMLYFTIK